VLFICGGAFVGLDKNIESRVGRSGMGFGAEIKSHTERRVGDLLAMIQPEDLLRYGLIPEFVDACPSSPPARPRRPGAGADPQGAEERDHQAVPEVLRPREGPPQVHRRRGGSIAKEALKRGTGARGLRAILEEVMLEIMYELPSIQGLKECIITREVILNHERPVLVSEAHEQSA